jgi:NAD(P)-dependent dehydrogenase (short-subunit alcohol dehydrogenase family)
MGYLTSDTVALVTGGTRGIGLEVARGLGHKGASVVLLGRDPQRAAQAAEDLQADGIDAVGEAVDATDPAALHALRERLGPLGGPDVLVLSAGVMAEKMTRTLRTSPQEWRRVMANNLDAAFYSLETFGQDLAKRRSGRVIALSACLGRFSGPGTAGGLAPYRISKAGLNAMVRNFAAEMQWGQRGVLVDAVCPGHCRTDMGGPDAPRSAQEGAETVVWLADREDRDPTGDVPSTGLLWEDREIVPW